MLDGPFAEAKELVAGYVILAAPALTDAVGWAKKYVEAVGCDETDVLALDDRPG